VPLVGTPVALGGFTGRAAEPISTYSQVVVVAACGLAPEAPPWGLAPESVRCGVADVSAADVLAEVVGAEASGDFDGIRPQPTIRQIVVATTSVNRYPIMRITLSRRAHRVADRRTRVRKVIGMVRLTRIYTRTGDGGQTRLADMSVTAKTDPRVAAYGDVDETNSVIGVALAAGELSAEVAEVLRSIQNELFDLGADLSNPLKVASDTPELRIEQPAIDRLESWCDRFGDPLPSLRSFILPGGSLAAAQLHVARTVARRAERSAWSAAERYGTQSATDDSPGGVNPLAITYLNRLSDLLFILTRAVNGPDGDVLWVPGGERTVSERR
jgi:cob(I)alamin adenosyltransferase